MNASARLAAALLCATIGFACASPIKTEFDTDPTVDMTAYRTYRWISQDPLIEPAEGRMEGPYISPLDDTRIRREVDRQLQARGYKQAQSKTTTDLVVTYGIGSQEKLRVRETAGRSSYYRGGYGYGTWYSGSSVDVQQYTEGTLTIELFDRRTKQAVWVGWGSKRLSENDEHEETIQLAVEKILEPLPARAGSPAATAASQ